MKTGCRVESPQFTREQRLQPAIALLSIVTLTLLQLRDAARRPDAKERKASEVISETYIEVLRVCGVIRRPASTGQSTISITLWRASAVIKTENMIIHQAGSIVGRLERTLSHDRRIQYRQIKVQKMWLT